MILLCCVILARCFILFKALGAHSAGPLERFVDEWRCCVVSSFVVSFLHRLFRYGGLSFCRSLLHCYVVSLFRRSLCCRRKVSLNCGVDSAFPRSSFRCFSFRCPGGVVLSSPRSSFHCFNHFVVPSFVVSWCCRFADWLHHRSSKKLR